MKYLILLYLAVGIQWLSLADGLTGTRTIPGDYVSLSAAITDLNAQGVGTGGVVISLLAGNPETAPAGGYAITTLSGTSSNTIVIQGNGNIIAAYTPQTAGALNDAIFKIIGGDYISILNFVMMENPANTITAAGTNNMTEFGIALFYASQTDGAKNITLQNNTISLNRLYQNSFGIYSNVRHPATSPTAIADITSPAGANDSTRIFGNTISNSNQGIVIVGSATAANMNTGIDIGGSSASTGNSVNNYGLTGSFSSFVSVALGIMGINLNNCLNSSVAYNTVNCPGLNTTGTVYGIYYQATGTLPTSGGPFNYSITHNSLAVKSGLSSGVVYGLYNSVGNAVISYNISYNDFNNMGHSTATASASVYCLYASGGANQQTISYNTFTNLALITTGNAYLVNYSNSMPLATSTQVVTHNSIVTAFSKSGSGGTVYCTYSNSTSVNGSTKTVAYNQFMNITLNGPAYVYGIYENDGGGNPVKSIHENTVSNVTTGNGGITGILFNYGSADIFNNTISNLTSLGYVNAMNCGGSNSSFQNVYSNVITGISGNSSSAFTGILVSASGSGAVSNIYRNRICNISGDNSASIVYGIHITAGLTVNVYNNMLSDLKTPAASGANNLVGIRVAGGTNVGLFFNTVFLSASSSGANFGSSALYASTTPLLNLINNILVNISVPNGTGITAAFRYSSTSLTNYSQTANNNCFYAGYPEDASHAVFYNGIATYSMAGFKTLVGPTRDYYSFLELPPFISVSTPCGDPHLNGGFLSNCSNGGIFITTPVYIATDFDGDTRQWAPDVGADEYWGPFISIFPPSPFTASALNSQEISLSFTPDPANDSVIIIWNTTGMFTIPAGSISAVGSSYAGGTLIYRGLNSPFLHTGLTGGITHYYEAFSFNGLYITTGALAFATTNVAQPASFAALAVSPSQVNLDFTLNAQGDDVVIAVNTVSAFGSPPNGTAVSVNDVLSGGGVILYKGPLTTFNHTALSPSTTYYYKIWSVDEFDYYSSTGIIANATTLCGPILNLPWNENFESVSIPAFPSCWSKENGDWVCTNNANSAYDADAHSGAQFFRESSYATDEFIWTPGFALLSGYLYDFSFWWAGDNNSGWAGDVFLNTSQTSLGATQIGSSFVSTGTVTSMTYTQVHEQFTVLVSGTYYFAIRVNATSIPWYLSFDDFNMEIIAPECPLAFGLTASGITDSSALISWNGISTNYDLEYGPAGFVLDSGTKIEGVSSPYTLTGLEANTSYSYNIGSICFPGPYGTHWSDPAYFTTEGIPGKTLNITCLLQGLYNGEGTMRKAHNGSTDQFTGSIVDQITIELHNAINYASIAYTVNNVNLNTSGQCTVNIPAILNDSYYITIRHRNSIGTTSAIPVSFAGGVINYDFTTIVSQAYGSNMIQMPDGKWVLYGGDVNQDGIVNENDIIETENLSSTFATGYIPEDVNGDGMIDAMDLIIVDNNSSNLISSIYPDN